MEAQSYATQFEERFYAPSNESFKSFVFDLETLYQRAHPNNAGDLMFEAVKQQMIKSLPDNLKQIVILSTENSLETLAKKISQALEVSNSPKLLLSTSSILITDKDLLGSKLNLFKGQVGLLFTQIKQKTKYIVFKTFALRSCRGNFVTVCDKYKPIMADGTCIGLNQHFKAEVLCHDYITIIAIKSLLKNCYLTVSESTSELFASMSQIEDRSEMFEVHFAKQDCIGLRALKIKKFINCSGTLKANRDILNDQETLEIILL